MSLVRALVKPRGWGLESLQVHHFVFFNGLTRYDVGDPHHNLFSEKSETGRPIFDWGGSSTVEHRAQNSSVVGSNPTLPITLF